MEINTTKHNSRTVASFLLLALFLCGGVLCLPAFAQAQPTAPYAKVGAYALYDMQGGAIAFFDGVVGNISYTVTNVFPSGNMSVRLSVNVSEGDEVPTSYQIYNYTDSILAPKIFPVVPLRVLGSSTITFQNVTLNYVKRTPQSVEAGTFQTLEYQGENNGTSVTFYFDNATGLAIYELSGSGALISLSSSNIANPLSVSDPANEQLPYVLVFVIVFAACGVGYYQITRYYGKRARRDFKKKYKKGNKTAKSEESQ